MISKLIVGEKDMFSENMLNFYKKGYPHIYEWIKLGVNDTPNGRQYMEENQNVIDEEYSDVIDSRLIRVGFGSDEKIHELLSYDLD